MRTIKRARSKPRSLQSPPDAGQEPRPERASRRSFLFFGALAATALVPRSARAQRVAPRRLAAGDNADDVRALIPRESVAAFAEWDSSASRLIRRATLGITPAEVQRANSLGYQGYLNYQLNYARIDDSAVETVVQQKWPLMGQTSDQLFSADAGQVRTQLQESTIYRAAFC